MYIDIKTYLNLKIRLQTSLHRPLMCKRRFSLYLPYLLTPIGIMTIIIIMVIFKFKNVLNFENPITNESIYPYSSLYIFFLIFLQPTALQLITTITFYMTEIILQHFLNCIAKIKVILFLSFFLWFYIRTVFDVNTIIN